MPHVNGRYDRWEFLSPFHPYPFTGAISPIDGWYIPFECSTKCKLYANNHFRCELRSVSCQTVFLQNVFRKEEEKKKNRNRHNFTASNCSKSMLRLLCLRRRCRCCRYWHWRLHVKCVFVDSVQSRSTIFIIEFVIFGKLSLKRRLCACKFNKVIDLQSADTMSLSRTLFLTLSVSVSVVKANSMRASFASLKQFNLIECQTILRWLDPTTVKFRLRNLMHALCG